MFDFYWLLMVVMVVGFEDFVYYDVVVDFEVCVVIMIYVVECWGVIDLVELVGWVGVWLSFMILVVVVVS